MRRRARWALALTAACVTGGVAPGGAGAQVEVPPWAEIKIENETLSLKTDRLQVKLGWRLDFGVIDSPQGNGQRFYFFSDLRSDLVLRARIRQACFTDAQFPYVLCPVPPVKRYVIRLGPLDDKLNIRAEVPTQAKTSAVQMGAGDDGVKGGKSNEKIDTGRGDDKANPGKGKDKVNLGAGDDTANTKDGEPDVLNGGKGDDSAVVDRGKDKVKNVEKVKRK